jgi:hypothetical protein
VANIVVMQNAAKTSRLAGKKHDKVLRLCHLSNHAKIKNQNGNETNSFENPQVQNKPHMK